jgi:hypothetical protein
MVNDRWSIENAVARLQRPDETDEAWTTRTGGSDVAFATRSGSLLQDLLDDFGIKVDEK